MNNRTLLTLLFVTGFVGFTSCGDDQNSNLKAENMALRQALMNAKNQQTVNVVNTVYATALVNVTQTYATSGTATSTGGTTVIYTVTSSSGSTSTGTAGRQ